MPCDYGSRHAQPISHLSIDEQNTLGFDNGQEVYVRRIQRLEGETPALTDEELAAAASNEKEYQSAKQQTPTHPPIDLITFCLYTQTLTGHGLYKHDQL